MFFSKKLIKVKEKAFFSPESFNVFKNAFKNFTRDKVKKLNWTWQQSYKMILVLKSVNVS